MTKTSILIELKMFQMKCLCAKSNLKKLLLRMLQGIGPLRSLSSRSKPILMALLILMRGRVEDLLQPMTMLEEHLRRIKVAVRLECPTILLTMPVSAASITLRRNPQYPVREM